MSFVIVVIMWISISVVVGILLGQWLDANDVLYTCPRCKASGGKVRNAITENAEHFARLAERLAGPQIVEFCWKCDEPRECRLVSHCCGTETLCKACGAQVDFDLDEDDYDDEEWDDDDDYDDDYDDEWDDDEVELDDDPVGSCQRCGTNLYVEDDVDFCDQCLWHETGGAGRDG